MLRGTSSLLRRSLSSGAARPKYRVAVTGAAGQIGYALLFRIASGHLFGPNADVELHCVDLPFAANALNGVKMELQDCAFPLLKKIVTTTSLDEGFDKIDCAILVGAKPRGPGMERQDLLKDNGAIFKAQGEALNRFANKDVKVLVVGNPANTNCLIAASHAPNLNPANFTAMTRLDHNRAIAQYMEKFNCQVDDVSKVAIWGNHSATQVPDYTLAEVKGKPVTKLTNDQEWFKKTFVPTVQQRGAAIIKARNLSSAASAASAALDHIRDWCLGTNGQWVSMAIPSGAYNVPAGVYFSYPVTCTPWKYQVVPNLKIEGDIATMFEATKKELFDERQMVSGLLGPAKI